MQRISVEAVQHRRHQLVQRRGIADDLGLEFQALALARIAMP